MDENAREKQIAALRREREGYVARDLVDRVQQVDKQLAALGAESKTSTADQPETPTARKRTAVPQGKRDAAG
jgi:hypothetical protein